MASERWQLTSAQSPHSAADWLVSLRLSLAGTQSTLGGGKFPDAVRTPAPGLDPAGFLLLRQSLLRSRSWRAQRCSLHRSHARFLRRQCRFASIRDLCPWRDARASVWSRTFFCSTGSVSAAAMASSRRINWSCMSWTAASAAGLSPRVLDGAARAGLPVSGDEISAGSWPAASRRTEGSVPVVDAAIASGARRRGGRRAP